MSDEPVQPSFPEQPDYLSQPITSNKAGVNIDAQRDVNIDGDVVGRGKIVSITNITDAQQYDVCGLSNPNLGLQSFTYVDHAKCAGREKLIAETVARLTAPADPLALLFVTGVSGSGKSSLRELHALLRRRIPVSVAWFACRISVTNSCQCTGGMQASIRFGERASWRYAAKKIDKIIYVS